MLNIFSIKYFFISLKSDGYFKMETEHVSEKNQLNEQLSNLQKLSNEKTIELEKKKEKLNQVNSYLVASLIVL